MAESPTAEVKGLLGHFGLRARRSLGQHFLVDRRVLQRIVSAADLTPQDVVIEVGPGLGVLTKELAMHAGRVIAVEADSAMASALSEVVAGIPNITIVTSDVLRTDPALLLAGVGVEGTSPGYKVVADIPYYITSPILRHFLEASLKPSIMVIMVQKEVGKAIVAQPGDMSILAVSVQFYGKPTIAGHAPSRSFYPPPKVDSVILRVELYKQPPVAVSRTGDFFDVVRAGFSAPRKQLRNSLAQGLGIPPKDAAELLQKANIDSKRRAETLNLREWAEILEEMPHHEE